MRDEQPRDVKDAIFSSTEAPTSVECPHPSVPPADTIPDEAWVVTKRHAVPPPGLDWAPFAGNPKDAIGSAKAPTFTVPTTIQAEDGLAMLEGALKYGRHNYRAAPVRASVYIDALRRHLNRWIEGEDIDAESNLSHLTKARACLGIMRDAQICGTLIDDRPPPAPVAFFDELDAKTKRLVVKYPDPVAPYVANDPRMAVRATRDAVEVELDALKARTLPR